uniref:Uncharacterized protein n=1 Tax=Aegilops tauschii subsp. strangulata TaxID=200361 RepID=A0A453E372_AEGTS
SIHGDPKMCHAVPSDKAATLTGHVVWWAAWLARMVCPVDGYTYQGTCRQRWSHLPRASWWDMDAEYIEEMAMERFGLRRRCACMLATRAAEIFRRGFLQLVEILALFVRKRKLQGVAMKW